ncbi:MAG: Tc toxin subunit A-related protein [Gammaproteobacteria bacterium]
MSAVIDRNTVFGNITFEEGSLAVPLIVRAFDKDMVSEELLGENGPVSASYSISYTADSFARAERRSADIIVRAFNEAGELLAESDVHHNVARNQRIDLIIAARHAPQEPHLSELELLQASIEDLREKVDYFRFTDEQIRHLIEETISQGIIGELRRPVVQQRLEFLRLAAQFEHETDIVLAAFYGWFRLDQPQSLDELLDVPISTLRETLQTAISRNIIPDIAPQIEEILERIRSLRFDRGRLVSHRLVAQLIDVETERPLSGNQIEITDPGAEPGEQSLGSVITDSLGVFTLVFNLPAEAPEDASRRLQLSISDDGFAVADTELEVRPHQDQVEQIRVRLRENERKEQPIDEVAPSDLAGRLRLRGIRTLGDLINNPDIEDEADPEAFERLRGMAKFAALAPDLDDDKREFLLDQGYRSLLDVADQSRAGFVRGHHEGLNGDAAAYANLRAAEKTTQLYQLMLNDAWFKLAKPDDDEPEDQDIPTGVNETLEEFKKCGCRDCDSAVSPAAYLAHMLQWTLKHIKDGEASISLAALNRTADRFGLGQPFANLPASCDAVEDRVRQVRICVEVLWGFTDLLELADLQMPTSFRNAYRHLRNQLYRDILTNLGTSFEQLRLATLNIQGNSLSAEQVEAQRQSTAALLGIDEERLDDLFFNVEQPPISPSEIDLERLFGFKNTRAEDVFSTPAPPQLTDWQRERLETIWQQQDWIMDSYRGDERLPFVDPELIDESYLRTPLEENAAFTLLEARREALASHREGLVAANPQQNGLADLLADELGQTIDVLRDLFATLQTTDQPEATEQALDTLSSLNLTPAGFTQLMGIDALLAAGRPIAATEEEVDAAWEAVFDILSRAHRHSLFPSWVTEEESLELVFGPKLFWMPVTGAPPPNPWQAAASERTDWEEALRERGSRPIIDPDQITTQHIIMIAILMLPSSPPVITDLPPTAFQRWEERRTWVNDRVAALRQAREGQPTRLDTLQAVLDASTLNINLDVLTELADSEAEGIDIQPRLAQLSLSLPGYRFLANIHLLAEGNATISADKWDEVVGILVQGEKALEFAEWREDEQESEIILHPLRFLLPANEPEIDDSPQNRWLHDTLALQQWKTTLKARSDQLLALTEALSKAVDVAAQKTLPLLRNILIMQAEVPGEVTTFDERADWLDKRLLIDMRMDGCHLTTRVSQAIETLQRLIRGVYTEEHISELQHLTLDAEEDYESDWSVIGSYPTWKSFMLVYLFPENTLHSVPLPKESDAFRHIKNSFPNKLRPEDACLAAEQYSEFFRDISNLKTEAVCQALTARPAALCSGKNGFHVLAHVFARSHVTGRVYVAMFDPKYPKDLIHQWTEIKKAGEVIRIAGATPHETPGGRRYIVLFVVTEDDKQRNLEYLRFDLEKLTWTQRKALRLPNDVDGDFHVAIIQKRPNVYDANIDNFSPALDFPTMVAVQSSRNIIYTRSLNTEATSWSSDGWFPLFEKHLPDKFFLNDPIRLVTLIQRTEDEYLVIIERYYDFEIYYRSLFLNFPGRDDLQWRRVRNLNGYRGALAMPLSRRIAVFTNQGGFMRYRNIRAARELNSVLRFSPDNNFVSNIDDTTNSIGRFLDEADEQLIALVEEFENIWLNKRVGVSLKDFDLSGLQVSLFAPTENPPDGQSNSNPLDPDDPDVGKVNFSFTFNGSLADLLKLRLVDLNRNLDIPSEAVFQLPSYYLIQIIDAGVKQFSDSLTSVRSKDFVEKQMGHWKLADFYVEKLSTQNSDSLTRVIASLAKNRIKVHRRFITAEIELKDINILFDNIEFKERQGEELGDIQSILGNWTLPPLSGDGVLSRGASVEQSLVLALERRTYITRMVRDGAQLLYKSSFPPIQITADNDGPHDIAPLRTKQELQIRKEEIKHVYRVNASELTKASLTVRSLLLEAYNLVPTYLGFGLQRNGYYDEALLCYRQVFDYLQVKDKRKIDYSLHLEQNLELTFDNAEDWLNDPSNPHSIAATRKNTYTRHILQLIIRCLIDYADQLFTNDNVTDNARARELYLLALKLLDLKALRPGESACADILGELEVEVVEPGQLPLAQFTAIFERIQNPDRLNTLITNLRAIDQNTDRRLDARLNDMREAVATALGDISAPKRMAAVLDTKEQTLRVTENYFLAHKPSRVLLEKSHQHHQQAELIRIADIARVSEDVLLSESPELSWLREARQPADDDDDALRFSEMVLLESDSGSSFSASDHIVDALPMASLVAAQINGFSIPDGISFDFCIPQNPVILALRTRAENNLRKLRTCRNIAGFVRPLDPYGTPIGIDSGTFTPGGRIFSGIIVAPPTHYRSEALIAKAKELVNIAQQIEAGYQTALERAEQEAFSVLQAENSLELAESRITLQNLAVHQSYMQLALASQQKFAAEERYQLYGSQQTDTIVRFENRLLEAYKDNIKTQKKIDKIGLTEKILTTAGRIVQAVFGGQGPSDSTGTDISILSAKVAGRLKPSELFQQMQLELSIETQKFEWMVQQKVADQDIQLGKLQINIANDGIDIALQQQTIAILERDHAAATLQFLTSKFFNEETYRWIASVLEDVYRFFLQQATSLAQLAERQLAFQRQEQPLKIIQANYWNIPNEGSGAVARDNTDRLGLTGSARLLKDIYQLDQYAFETRQRKQALSITLDLAQLFPLEFQQFRETGVLIFETPLSLIDRQMPGYYLCLIQQVTVSVVALIPPDMGIRATLTSAGTSRVVVGGDTFQTVTIQNQPERIALTAPTTTSGIIDLQPDAQSFLNPFEGSGFDTLWELRMPKAANPWDYNTMATVLFTVNFTALHSYDYERQVIENLDPNISYSRNFDFRQVFADPWYDLNNPNQTDTPMTVRFETRRSDFPPNLSNLAIEHVVVYLVRKDGETFEQEIRHLRFTSDGATGFVGGPASSVDGRISTRSGNGTNWLPMIGLAPFGQWELAFPDNPPVDTEARERFASERIENLLLVITFSGRLPTWPS